MVVGGLVALALGGLIGIITLAVLHVAIPDVLQNVTIGSMTALGGILSKTSTSEDDPQPVQVMNAPADPVPVEPGA